VSGYEDEIERLVALHPHCRAEVTPADVLCARGRPRSVLLDADRILALRPCPDWPAERVTRHIGDRAVLLAEVLRCAAVPAADRLWVACQPGVWAAPSVTLRWLVADFAASVLPICEAARPGDLRPRRAIEAARLYALGLISCETLAAAGAAAWAAAMAAAGAAGDAAWAAAWAAARDAAGDAAGDAAWAAAWAAAMAAAGAAGDAAWAAAWAAARAAAWAAGDAAWAAAGAAAWAAAGAARDAARDAAGDAHLRRVLDLLGAA
jgi:hypothetical protein